MARVPQRRLEAALARLQPVDVTPTPAIGGIDGFLDALESVAAGAQSRLSDAESLVAALRAALDLVSQGVVVCDAQGKEVYRNAGAVPHGDVGHAEILADQAVAEQLTAALRGSPGHQLVELFAPTRRHLLIRAFPLAGPNGPLGAVALVEDFTDRQRLEAVRRDFVANVSHELKTPVGALSLLAETLDGEEDSEVVARLSARVATEAARLGRIIDDLLDLSRIEANEAPRTELLDVCEVLGEALEPSREVAATRNIAVEVGLPPGLVIAGDRRDLVSAVLNLVDNAIKYSGDGSSVQVTAELADAPRVAGRAVGSGPGADPLAGRVRRWVAIRVADRGIGIPPRDLERVFERFYRVDRARSRTTGGTGLGLSIVRHVVANHGGVIDVQSVEGEGSTFTVYLPAAMAATRKAEAHG